MDYFTECVDLEMANELVEELIEKADQLKENPYSGPIEPLLSHRKKDFRYLVKGNYKSIYFIDELNIT